MKRTQILYPFHLISRTQISANELGIISAVPRINDIRTYCYYDPYCARHSLGTHVPPHISTARIETKNQQNIVLIARALTTDVTK